MPGSQVRELTAPTIKSRTLIIVTTLSPAEVAESSKSPASPEFGAGAGAEVLKIKFVIAKSRIAAIKSAVGAIRS